MLRVGKFIITGRPGSGKSTCAMLIVKGLRERGIKVGGIRTPELREGGVRKGFFVEDLLTGEREVFASTEFEGGPSVSKYVVDLARFESVAIAAISRASEECEVVVIDEIGKMELLSSKFIELVMRVWNSDSVAVGTAPLARIREVEYLKSLSEVVLIERGEAERVSSYLISKINRILRERIL